MQITFPSFGSQIVIRGRDGSWGTIGITVFVAMSKFYLYYSSSDRGFVHEK